MLTFDSAIRGDYIFTFKGVINDLCMLARDGFASSLVHVQSARTAPKEEPFLYSFGINKKSLILACNLSILLKLKVFLPQPKHI